MYWKSIKTFFLLSFFVLISQNLKAQVSVQTFIDPCTKEVTLFTVPLQGGTTIFFLNKSRYFTAADVTSGVFSSWINQTYTEYRQTNPCSQQQGQVTQNQITSQIISSTVQSVVGSIMASAQSSATSGGGNLNAGNNKKDENKQSKGNSNGSGNNNNGSGSSSQGGENGGQSQGSGGTTGSTGGNGSSQGGSTGTQGGNSTGSNNSTQGGSGSSQPPVGGSGTTGGGTTGGSGSSGSGTTGGSGSGGSGSTGGSTTGGSGSGGNGSSGSGTTGGSTTGGSGTTSGGTTGGSGSSGNNGESSQQSSQEVGATTVMNNDAHNDNGSGSESGGSKGGGKNGKSGSTNPLIISSDLTTAQNLDKTFTPILNLSMNRSSMTGLSSVGATAMIWANLRQFAVSAKYTKLNYNKKNTIKYIHNVNLTGVYTYGNILGFLGYSGILNAGKWGITGFNVSAAVSIISEDKSGYYSPSVTAFYTRPFKVSRKLLISPELYVMSTPLVYSTKEQVTITDRYFSAFVGSGFDYQISKRFKLNMNYKANLSSNPEIPILSFFLIGSKVNL